MKHTKTLYVGCLLADCLETRCREPDANLQLNWGLAKDQLLFDEEVIFDNGRFMTIQVCQPSNNDMESCWVKAMLYIRDGCGPYCSEVGDRFRGDYRLEYGGDEYIVTVADLDVSGPLTTAEEQAYLAARGQRCPKCRRKRIKAYTIDADGPTATSDAFCCDCGYRWVDIYELRGIKEA
jgi:hypothetical protein